MASHLLWLDFGASARVLGSLMLQSACLLTHERKMKLVLLLFTELMKMTYHYLNWTGLKRKRKIDIENNMHWSLKFQAVNMLKLVEIFPYLPVGIFSMLNLNPKELINLPVTRQYFLSTGITSK